MRRQKAKEASPVNYEPLKLHFLQKKYYKFIGMLVLQDKRYGGQQVTFASLRLRKLNTCRLQGFVYLGSKFSFLIFSISFFILLKASL